MNAKNNRVNHDFQIVHFLAGSCHTPDGAYSLLCDLRADRRMALASAKSQSLRAEAKRLRVSEAVSRADGLDAQADVVEMDALAENGALCVAAAVAELATIERCIESLKPLRKFAHLSDPEAHEAAQRDEWRAELMHRAESHLLTQGSGVPPELFATMRMHPDFATHIFPALEEMNQMLRLVSLDAGRKQLVESIGRKPFALPWKDKP